MSKSTSAGLPPAASTPVDDLNARIGVLTRREVEARILAPLVEALSREFGREDVLRVLETTVFEIARQQGAALVDQMGDDSLAAFAESLKFWTQDDALSVDVIVQDEERFDFNVTRCRYAELYQALGVPELGALFSCNRDRALIEGFRTDITLTRTQTIMEGASYCDFRYRRQRQTGALEP
jgi:hypothetical protein